MDTRKAESAHPMHIGRLVQAGVICVAMLSSSASSAEARIQSWPRMVFLFIVNQHTKGEFFFLLMFIPTFKPCVFGRRK